jgi:hypothetical protein
MENFMPRARKLKMAVFTDERLKNCSLEARHIFIWLLFYVDDNGVHPACELLIKDEILPSSSLTDILTYVSELFSKNLITQYDKSLQRYWMITHIKNYLQSDGRPAFRFPLPDDITKKNAILGADIQPCTEFSDLKDNTADEQWDKQGTLPKISENSVHEIDEIDTFNVSEQIYSGSVINNKNIYIPKEKETTQRKSKGKNVQLLPSGESLVRDIFSHWQTVHNKHRAQLTPDRRYRIQTAIQWGYTVADLKQAIDGCRRSDWHMGTNDRNTPYNDITLILRDGERIERFMDWAINPPKSQNSQEQKHGTHQRNYKSPEQRTQEIWDGIFDDAQKIYSNSESGGRGGAKDT